jgi:membrane protein DedA with SNARE-associated domain
MTEIINFIVQTVSAWGYPGIFILMAIESSFIPLPSEIVLIPAGYLVQKGEMNGFLVLLNSTFGSLFGALVNYYLALWVGKPFLYKYGKYFFISPESLGKTEHFFKNHGSISTFSGRLIPVIRHLISIPAGLARMNLVKFSFYTTIGAAIWSAILIVLGYVIGENEELIHQYLQIITAILLFFLTIFAFAYVLYNKKKAKNKI